MAIDEDVRRTRVVALEMPDPVLLDENTPVRRVIETMRRRSTGVAILTRASKPRHATGIFTERDVMMKTLGEAGALEGPVSELMTADPITVGEDTPIGEALATMNREGFRHLPVCGEGGEITSCVRHKDIVHYLVEHFAERLLNLPPDPDQRALTPEGG